MSIRRLSLQQAEFIAHRLAVELMNSEIEPVPPFDTRAPGKLESCLAEPFQTFDGKYLHRTLIERAAVLFYLVTKNHCFSNGNKRMAVTLTTLFFFINKRWLNISPVDLYKISCDVAISHPRHKLVMQQELAKLFKKCQVHL